MNPIIWIILLTLLPFLELRYSIPAGILTGTIPLPFGLTLVGFGLPVWEVFLIAVITNMVLGIVLYILLDKVVHIFLHIRPIAKLYRNTIEQMQKRIQRYVDRFGTWGVAIFIGIPLPGSGVYSGALGAYAIGLDFARFAKAQAVGVLIAGTLVTLLTLGAIAL